MKFAIFASFFLAASALAGPKIFMPLEAPKPVVCEKVCPICGHCWPKPFSGETGLDKQYFYCQTPNRDGTVHMLYNTLTGKEDTLGFGTFKVDTAYCDSIVWGRMRKICRIDTVGTGVIKYCVWGKPAVRTVLMIRLDDSILTGYAPFMASPDARGVSTFYLQKGRYGIVRIADNGVTDGPDSVTVGDDYPDYRIDTVFCEDTVPPSAPSQSSSGWFDTTFSIPGTVLGGAVRTTESALGCDHITVANDSAILYCKSPDPDGTASFYLNPGRYTVVGYHGFERMWWTTKFVLSPGTVIDEIEFEGGLK